MGMIVCEFDGQFITSDNHLTELMKSITESKVTYKITFSNLYAPKTLEEFAAELRLIS